ncbi:RHS repeat-associated core domain-containing protein [Pragia fontium]|uniref:RHS repeat-associated core domain-containing protein n=1 Tax=Pragia fontium DSM 5563 = ATCC 49100 TaxID=1122977 RepID=A0AAJ4WCD0_9GAMM|nr:RHS repeat-associated core domain-containing protein [Pragia fontium]SFD17843.1 RHS repeat-associated core domain-containing protein [Pragia fontium DSM 5563 = ATCC 49100]VEJ52901.1 Cell wall-associated polypeptide CWBP200 [Pragia fontium]
MSGKPAARQGDATLTGGPIVQGSASVLIGTPSGVACSTCPGGMAVGNPVNPSLGAKILSGETDIALLCPMPFVLSRSYSSYQTDTPGPVGMFGPGWQAASNVSLLVMDDALILNDNGGRSLHFEPLAPGEVSYSRSEDLWLVRGGIECLPNDHPLATLWLALPLTSRLCTHTYFVSNNAIGPWWILNYVMTAPQEGDVLPPMLPARRYLLAIVDRFGQQLTYRRDSEGLFAGEITEVMDGAGRHYHLELIDLIKDDEHFSDMTAVGWGTDKYIRLSAVYLTKDPLYPDVPVTPLVRYEYTSRGELAAVYDRAGCLTRRFEYHPELLGRITSHQYIGRPASFYEYDNQGRVITQTNLQGLNYQFSYQPNQTIVTDSLERQQVYHFEGERGLRRLVKLEQADGSITSSEYDGSGRLKAQIDALGRKTEFDIDVASGRLLGLTAPDGAVTRFSYNRQRQLTSTIHPNSSRTTSEYDVFGRLVSATDLLGNTSRYHYQDESSELLEMTEDARGGQQWLSWTPHGQVSAYIDCSGYQIKYHYDRWGQITEIAREEGMVSWRHYNARGWLIASENANHEQTRYEYNAAGDLITIVHPDGSHETMVRSELGQPLETVKGGLMQQYRYDAAGRLELLVNENGAETHFSYDVMNRLTTEKGFDGRTQHYHYNAVGELVQSKDEGLATHWYYDLAGRLIRRQHPHSVSEIPNDEQWDYDQSGQLLSARHISEGYSVSINYLRDKAGNIIEELQQVQKPDGKTLWQYKVNHQYDPRGFRHETLLEGLPSLRWQTYGPGHLLGVALGDRHLIEFSRDRLHRESERRFGEVQLHTDYDTLGRLARFEMNEQPLHPMNREHHYDLRGQMTGITLPEGALHYRYDEVGRLTEAQRSGPEGFAYRQNWRFDLAGNRLSSELPESTETDMGHNISRMGNRITQDEHYHYHYDRYGNLIEKHHKLNSGEVHHFAYDRQHRLVRYTRLQDNQSICQAHYLYDPMGRRVGKQVIRQHEEPETVWYGWDGDRIVLTESNDKRVYTVYYPQSFVPLLRIEGDSPSPVISLAQKLEQQSDIVFPTELNTQFNQIEQQLRASALTADNQRWLQQLSFEPEYLTSLLDPLPVVPDTVHLYHCDHLGTPIALMTPKGEVEWQAELDAWGNMLSQHSIRKLNQPIRLQGQQQDEESGLYYNRYRYYDPRMGRYISQDPIGLMGGMHKYNYPLNPIQFIDPMGLVGIISGPYKAAIDSYQTGVAFKILSDTESDMKRLNLKSTDNFFHCMGFCRVSKNIDAKNSGARGLGVMKETRDYILGRVGLYGDKRKRSHEEMIQDNISDLAVNEFGLSCPQDIKCSDRCKSYINENHTETIKILEKEGYL